MKQKVTKIVADIVSGPVKPEAVKAESAALRLAGEACVSIYLGIGKFIEQVRAFVQRKDKNWAMVKESAKLKAGFDSLPEAEKDRFNKTLSAIRAQCGIKAQNAGNKSGTGRPRKVLEIPVIKDPEKSTEEDIEKAVRDAIGKVAIATGLTIKELIELIMGMDWAKK